MTQGLTLDVASRMALPKPQDGEVGNWLTHWFPNVLLNDFACHLSLPVEPMVTILKRRGDEES